jgi:hypothetical protein
MAGQPNLLQRAKRRSETASEPLSIEGTFRGPEQRRQNKQETQAAHFKLGYQGISDEFETPLGFISATTTADQLSFR